MENESSKIIDLAKKKVNPSISFRDRHPIDNLNARVSLKISDNKISHFIIDFIIGNSTGMYQADLAHLKDNFKRIEYIQVSDAFIFNEFVQNYNALYKLSDNLIIELLLPNNSYENPIKLTGKRKNYLQFNFKSD